MSQQRTAIYVLELQYVDTIFDAAATKQEDLCLDKAFQICASSVVLQSLCPKMMMVDFDRYLRSTLKPNH